MALTITLLEGDAARRWMGVDRNLSAWNQLYDDCPWRCPFLSSQFAAIWYSLYCPTWQPMLLIAEDESSQLAGLFPLAARHDYVTGVGAQQAEYQGWLSTEHNASVFFQGAVKALLAARPTAQLYLRYLAPGAAADAVRNVTDVYPLALVSEHARPLMRIDAETAAAVLKKKSNRSKWSRLSKLGDLQAVRLTDEDCRGPAFDTIADVYDIRQGAVYGNCPFHEDPNKKALFQQWLKTCPEQVRIDALLLDGNVIAALIGVVCGDHLANLVLAHAPAHARHSPGKLLIYKIAQYLDAEQFTTFDLTPGVDSWKQRFADTHDAVLEMTLWGDAGAGKRALLRQNIEDKLRALLRVTGLSPAALRRTLAAIRAPSGNAKRENGAQRPSVYCIHIDDFAKFDDTSTGSLSVTVNDLDALCRFQPVANTQQEFLSDALTRIERGEDAYCVLDESGPMLVGWMVDARAASRSAEFAHVSEITDEDGVVLHGLQIGRTEARSIDSPALPRVLHQVLNDAATAAGGNTVYLVTPWNYPHTGEVEAFGFKRLA